MATTETLLFIYDQSGASSGLLEQYQAIDILSVQNNKVLNSPTKFVQIAIVLEVRNEPKQAHYPGISICNVAHNVQTSTISQRKLPLIWCESSRCATSHG